MLDRFSPTGYFITHDNQFSFEQSYEVNLNPGHKWTYSNAAKQQKRIKRDTILFYQQVKLYLKNIMTIFL